MNRLKLSSLMLLSMPIGLTFASNPVYAQTCPMYDPIHSLPDCVIHHWEMGDTDNKGIYESLLSRAQNAVALYEAGNSGAAINILNSFINKLEAQSGKHISASAAEMLINHAEMAIEQIN